MNGVVKKRLLIITLIALVLLRTPSFFQDFMDSDEGIYGSVALTILNGEEPYRDAIERKTPAAYYLYAGVFALFGLGNMLAVHLLMVLWIGISAFLLAIRRRIC